MPEEKGEIDEGVQGTDKEAVGVGSLSASAESMRRAFRGTDLSWPVIIKQSLVAAAGGSFAVSLIYTAITWITSLNTRLDDVFFTWLASIVVALVISVPVMLIAGAVEGWFLKRLAEITARAVIVAAVIQTAIGLVITGLPDFSDTTAWAGWLLPFTVPIFAAALAWLLTMYRRCIIAEQQ